jgi:hypothetical protein
MATGFPTKANWVSGDILTAAQMDDLAGTVNFLSPVGQTNGSTLVANSSNASGLGWNLNYAAGKNAIINGDFRIWQRGTSFSNPTNGTYNADRFFTNRDGSGTVTCSQQAFTAGTAPVAGYEGTYFFRWNQTVAGTGGTYNQFVQRIEDVRVFAGQTVTVSFWAKAAATTSINLDVRQEFGSGGSTTVVTAILSATNLTTGWVRYTGTVAVPSISGKTIGTSSSLGLYFNLPANTVITVDIWGVQLEAGSVATAFQTATGTVQGELAACQRYYQRYSIPTATGAGLSTGVCTSTTIGDTSFVPPVPFRVAPTTLDTLTPEFYTPNNNGQNTSGTFTLASFTTSTNVVIRYTHGSAVFTAGYAGFLSTSASSGYYGIGAEL